MKPILLFLWLGLLSAGAWPSLSGAPLSNTHSVGYRIEARLIPAEKKVQGTEILTWRNYAPDPVATLPFHLYMNAFESRQTTFFSEGQRGLRWSDFNKKESGWCRLTSVSIDGLGDLSNRIRFIQPDDNNPDDHTVAEIPLPRPVSPGETLTIRIKFETKLPKIYARAGYVDDYFFMGQWFPKIGVLEPPGWRHAPATRWNCHQFHRSSEFYANFADYEARLTAPTRFIVGATGVLADKTKGPGPDETTYVYRQDRVHDFAWVASPHFVETHLTFSGVRDVPAAEYQRWAALLGVSPESLRLPDVEMILLMDKAHLDFTPISISTLKEALTYYGLMDGPYPYHTITLVDPAPGAEASAGMEYPTLFTAGTHPILNWWPFNQMNAQGVITHEFGHNYWYGIIANNEFEEAWIDEGINSFTESLIYNQARARAQNPLLGPIFMDSFMMHRNSLQLISPPKDALNTYSWKFYPGQYSANAYARTTVILLTLQGLMGEQHFLQTMRSIYQRFQFTHPDTIDFVEAFAGSGGEPVRRFLEQSFAPGAWVDFAVDDVSNSMKDRKTGRVESYARLVRKGTIQLPVEVQFQFENGRTVSKTWDGQASWITFEFDEPARLKTVVIDPGYIIALDTNLANNSHTIFPRDDLVSRWKNIVQFSTQLLMQFLSLLA